MAATGQGLVEAMVLSTMDQAGMFEWRTCQLYTRQEDTCQWHTRQEDTCQKDTLLLHTSQECTFQGYKWPYLPMFQGNMLQQEV